jgi:P pilus assembly chaperone PapD
MTRLRIVRAPWPLAAALVVGALVWVFAIVGVRSLFGQVASTVPIAKGEAATPVRNPAPAPMAVTVALYTQDTTRTDRVGRPVGSIVAPSSFLLGPGETQTVRLRLRETFPPGTVLRLVTTYTPADTPSHRIGAETAAVSQVVIVTRLVTKAVVQ